METTPFTLPRPEDQGRLWMRDLVHAPRALPPLVADLNIEFVGHNPMGLEGISVNGYSYMSLRGAPPAPGGAPIAPPADPSAPNEAIRTWHDRVLPEMQQLCEKYRGANYAAMSAPELLAFVLDGIPEVMDVMGKSVLSAMQITPDADRLHAFLETRLGAEADLLSASILHGSGSETRSLGSEVERLTEAARRTPGIAEALSAGNFGLAATASAEPWASAFAAFVADHEDELALWTEVHVPTWNEDPLPLLRQVAALHTSGSEGRRDTSAEQMASVRQRLAPEDLPEFEAAIAQSRHYVPIIEQRARWQLKLIGSVRRGFVELGARLVAAGQLDAANDIFTFHRAELPDVVAGRFDAKATAKARWAEWREQLELRAPLTLGPPVPIEMVGMISPVMRRMFGAVALPEPTAGMVHGVAANAGVVRGRARVVFGLDEAEDLVDGDILVCPSTSPPWTPYFAVVAAIVTDAGGVVSHAAIEAREYGIPAVVGTREGTRLIPEGAMITVDGGAGTVTIER